MAIISKITLDQFISLEIFLDVLKRFKNLVQCTLCFETPLAQANIYQCINGHIVCNICFEEYNRLRSSDVILESFEDRHQPRCPTCRAKEFGIRSLVAEQILEKVNESVDLIKSQ